MKVCVPPGSYCDIMTGGKQDGKCKGNQIEVDENGKAQIFIPKNADIPIVAFHIESKL
jgi:alpha-amylase